MYLYAIECFNLSQPIIILIESYFMKVEIGLKAYNTIYGPSSQIVKLYISILA